MFDSVVSSDEFLAVRHSVLNGNTYDIDKLIEDTVSFERCTNGRKIVPCFEGDIVQVSETGEVVLTHQNFLSLTLDRYTNLRSRKLAAPLEEVLDKVALHKQRGGEEVVLCFEPKLITSETTIFKTVNMLKEYGIEEAYFDSFLVTN